MGLIIECRNLGMSYADGTVRVLQNLDFDVQIGEFVVILGRSGSGKSTLLNILGAMDVATRGRVAISGVALGDLMEAGRTQFRRKSLGFIFQTYNLVPTLTVAQSLQLPLELNALAPNGKIETMLATLGLNGLGARYPEELSGGEQQRVAVGRALIHTPQLVLADEPTGNLDSIAGEGVLTLIKTLSRTQGATVVMATHSADVARHADRVLQMHDGQLIEGP